MLVQLLDDCVNLIVHGTVPEDVFSARLYVNRVMSSLTHAFTMDDKRRSEWRSQRELETRAKISQTFHVCKRRLSILLATQQVSWDETLCEFKGPDGCRHFFLFLVGNVGTELLRIGRKPNGAGLRYGVGQSLFSRAVYSSLLNCSTVRLYLSAMSKVAREIISCITCGLLMLFVYYC